MGGRRGGGHGHPDRPQPAGAAAYLPACLPGLGEVLGPGGALCRAAGGLPRGVQTHVRGLCHTSHSSVHGSSMCV